MKSCVSLTIVYLHSRDPDKVITPLGGSYVIENVQCCILQVESSGQQHLLLDVKGFWMEMPGAE